MFWPISFALLLAGALVTLWPLLSRDSSWKWSAMAGVVLLPLAGYGLYQGIGTPEALSQPAAEPLSASSTEMPGAEDMNQLVDQLRQRLQDNPEELQGWLLLGRSYKTLQNYRLAVEALETASRLAPDQPLVQVELVEARLFDSGNPLITAEMIVMLEQAVAVEPSLQKGLWLLGIAAAQAGDDTQAVSWWEKLLAQVEPGSPVENSVREQITQAKARLGQAVEPESAPLSVAESNPPAPTAKPANAWPGAEIRVELSAEAQQAWAQIPPEAVLFIIARPEGTSGGPPIGARRVTQPQFPLDVTLTDGDSMMQQRPVSSVSRLSLQARLSRSGQPTSSPGDWHSAVVPVAGLPGEITVLRIDQVAQ